jgi:hypothetical protein
MIEIFGFLTSRIGIALVGTLAVSMVLAGYYYQKSERLNERNLLLQSERDYQARIAESLEQQRKALDIAVARERKRRVALEQKWKDIDKSLQGNADYGQTAPASIIHTLNSLSDDTSHR